MSHFAFKAAVAAGALALTGAAAAHPHPHGDETEKVRKVIVLSGKDGELKAGERLRVFNFEREGRGMVCDGDKTEVSEATGTDKKERTRIVLCGKSGDTAERARRLEEALARIEKSDEISAEHKSKVTAALRDALDRARAGN